MSRHPEHRRVRVAWPVLLGVLVAGASSALTGCTSSSPPANPSTSSVAPSGSPLASAPADLELVPGGSAAENLPLFASVVSGVAATPDSVSGRAYIDALVAAGFDRSAMQLTPDQSTVGNPAESIQFSVRWNDECLVGQVGPATGAPVTVVVPVLAEGTCLVGETRPIDW